MTRLLRFATVSTLVLLAPISLVSCKKIDCGRYEKYTKGSRDYHQVVEWADRNVFDQKLTADQLRYGNLIGPGRRALSKDISKNLPRELAGAEVRIIGGSWSSPDLIFVGFRRYQGILVSRIDVGSSLAAAGLSPSLVYRAEGRTALMCYHEAENMQEK